MKKQIFLVFYCSTDNPVLSEERILQQTKNKAIVDANIIYTMKNGDIWTDPSGVITLILDVNGNWLINDKSA